jgi:hypothetical protein
MKLKSLVLGAVLAFGALAGAAPRAEAAVQPLFRYRTIGGFTMFQTDLRIYATGFVVATEQFHNGQALVMTGRISRSELNALRAAVPSNFRRLPAQVYFGHMVADIPSRAVTVSSKTVTWVPMAGRPIADQAFEDFASKLGDVFNKVATADFCTYAQSGGFAYHEVELVVKNNGQCHLTQQGLGGDIDKDGYIAVTDLNDLKAIFARGDRRGAYWYQMPSRFTASGADLETFSITYGGRTVTSMTGAQEWTTFRLAREALAKMVDTVKNQ